MLLHYFTYEEVYQNANFTPLEYLALQENNSTYRDSIGCQLCFDPDCKNNGFCLDKANSYICECPAGYTEDDCSFNIDECINNKCENGATCIDGIANYTCICNNGWQGWLSVYKRYYYDKYYIYIYYSSFYLPNNFFYLLF